MLGVRLAVALDMTVKDRGSGMILGVIWTYVLIAPTTFGVNKVPDSFLPGNASTFIQFSIRKSDVLLELSGGRWPIVLTAAVGR